MTRLRRRAIRAEDGQSLLEFALMFPLLVLIIVGIFDLGRGVYAYNTIANAAREGARIAAVNQIEISPDCANNRPVVNPATPHWSIRRCAAQAAVSLGIDPVNDISVTYSPPTGVAWNCSTLRIGCLARVEVRYGFTPATPVLSNMLGPIPMSAQSEMPIERVFP